MHKIHSYQLQRVAREIQPLPIQGQLSQLEAQESLFEISKYDETDNYDKMIRDITRNKTTQKRYEKIPQLPPPKKKIEEKEPPVDRDYKLFRQTYESIAGRPVSITNFIVIDNKKHRRRMSDLAGGNPEKGYTQSMRDQMNRKAKHLFRLRNRKPSPLLGKIKGEAFHESFYCSKLEPIHHQED